MRLFTALVAFLCWLLVSCVIATSCTPAYSSDRLHVTDYDPYIKRGAMRWIPDYDWRWLRALCYQESRFQPRAVSPVGARGLCQFMPATWAEARRAIGVRDVFDPAENAWASGWYVRRQLSIWTWRRTDYQRLELALASYNAGAGNVLAAQRECGGAITWDGIRPCLPAVTGHHSAETIGYVRNIRRWYRSMQWSNN
jgi:membrane-bound lytic murein transglycosylase F